MARVLDWRHFYDQKVVHRVQGRPGTGCPCYIALAKSHRVDAGNLSGQEATALWYALALNHLIAYQKAKGLHIRLGH